MIAMENIQNKGHSVFCFFFGLIILTRIRNIHVHVHVHVIIVTLTVIKLSQNQQLLKYGCRIKSCFGKCLTNQQMKFKKLTNWCRVHQTRAHGCCVEFLPYCSIIVCTLQCTNQFPRQNKLVDSTGLSFTEISAFPVFLYKDFFIHQYSLCMFSLIFIRCERGQRLKKQRKVKTKKKKTFGWHICLPRIMYNVYGTSLLLKKQRIMYIWWGFLGSFLLASLYALSLLIRTTLGGRSSWTNQYHNGCFSYIYF